MQAAGRFSLKLTAKVLCTDLRLITPKLSTSTTVCLQTSHLFRSSSLNDHHFVTTRSDTGGSESEEKIKMAVPASSIFSPGASKNPKFKNIADVAIDKSGKFKYILLKVHDPEKVEREFKHIVRGFNKASFHADIFDEISPAIEDAGLDCECVGGGRIQHDPNKRKIEIFGYSQGFGQADHRIAAALISKKYPSYDNITWNNDGY